MHSNIETGNRAFDSIHTGSMGSSNSYLQAGRIFTVDNKTWIAEPTFSIYSKCFSSEKEATDALIEKYKEFLNKDQPKE